MGAHNFKSKIFDSWWDWCWLGTRPSDIKNIILNLVHSLCFKKMLVKKNKSWYMCTSYITWYNNIEISSHHNLWQEVNKPQKCPSIQIPATIMQFFSLIQEGLAAEQHNLITTASPIYLLAVHCTQWTLRYCVTVSQFIIS